MRRHTAFAVACVVLAGCASRIGSGSDARSTVGAGSEVSGRELVSSGARTLYDALVRTRAGFFRSRGASSLYEPAPDAMLVFHGGMLMGDVESLRAIPASAIRTARRIGPVETFHRYGRTVSIGAIELEFVHER